MTFTEIISDGSKKGIAVGLLHIALIFVAYTSPLWIDWKIIVIGVVLLFLEQIIFRNCVLNASQYGKENSSGMLYENILTHFGIKYERSRLRIWLQWIIPLIVLGVAVVIQYAGLIPLVRFY